MSVILFILIEALCLLEWDRRTFGVTYAEILYTMESPLNGADTGFLNGALRVLLITSMLSAFIILAFNIIGSRGLPKCATRTNNDSLSIRFVTMSNIFLMATLSCFVLIVLEAEDTLKIGEYYLSKTQTTNVYEEYYSPPNVDAITSDTSRNLIHIYLESMENTYASVEEGGNQQNNYIPYLTQLAWMSFIILCR